ncbi:MAG: metallophosphoesterase [Opitutales bacterium]
MPNREDPRPILLIPDIHQNDRFLASVLERHPPESLAEIILLGDLLDARSDAFKTADALAGVLRQLHEIREEERCTVTQLLGNHDWDYLQMWPLVERSVTGKLSDVAVEFSIYALSLCTAGALMEPADVNLPYTPEDDDLLWPLAWWKEARLGVFRRGYLISHAGLHPDHLPADLERSGSSVESYLNMQLGEAWKRLEGGGAASETSPLLRAGRARGGELARGGPLWLDWKHEFEDALPFPQIVGHTPDARPRRSGRSWCLDCAQTHAALLHADGRLEPFKAPWTGHD